MNAACGGDQDVPVSTADPFRLRRFTDQQRTAQPRAIGEIRKGQRESCWMWYVLPTPPHLVNGVEQGSANNAKYALRSDEEVRAYLDFRADGVDLRANYLATMGALRDTLTSSRNPFERMEEPKVRSSLKLFERISREDADQELNDVIRDVMAFFGVKRANSDMAVVNPPSAHEC